MGASIPDEILDKLVTFGELLRYLRRRAGLTQTELSDAGGYSDAQISRLDQNMRLPNLATIQARFLPALKLKNETAAMERLLALAQSASHNRANSDIDGREINPTGWYRRLQCCHSLTALATSRTTIYAKDWPRN